MTAPVQESPIPELPSVTDFLEGLLSLVPSLLALLAVITVALLLGRWLEEGAETTRESHRMRNQLLLLGVTVVGAVVVIVLLPISDTVRGQILSLIGIVLSASIALSSTTFLGNMLAGVMLRAVKSFRTGDFVRVEEHFGRVSERGLFHTELQTEHRELTTLPNLFLVTHPVTTVRSSGTVVSASVSLGYDISHVQIEERLREGATRAGLDDPFVLVQDLGDFSVTYRVAGMLTDVESLITARSRLRAAVLDALHEGGLEIVSPTFMNQRRLERDQRFIPHPRRASEPTGSMPEDLVFDKAREAEKLEKLEERLDRVAEEIATVEADLEEAPEDARAPHQRKLERLRAQRERLRGMIDAAKSGTAGE